MLTHPFRRMVTDNKKLFRQRKILSIDRTRIAHEQRVIPEFETSCREVVHKVIRPVKNGFLGANAKFYLNRCRYRFCPILCSNHQ